MQSGNTAIRSSYEPRYFPQETNYTCGPACLRMMLATLLGTEISESELAREMGTSAEHGTQNSAFVSSCTPYLSSLSLCVGSGASLDTLKRLLAEGYLVLVNYIHGEKSSGHFGLVHQLTDNEILLVDPESGPEFSIPLSEFNWKSGDGLHHQWYFALKRRS